MSPAPSGAQSSKVQVAGKVVARLVGEWAFAKGLDWMFETASPEPERKPVPLTAADINRIKNSLTEVQKGLPPEIAQPFKGLSENLPGTLTTHDYRTLLAQASAQAAIKADQFPVSDKTLEQALQQRLPLSQSPVSFTHPTQRDAFLRDVDRLVRKPNNFEWYSPPPSLAGSATAAPPVTFPLVANSPFSTPTLPSQITEHRLESPFKTDRYVSCAQIANHASFAISFQSPDETGNWQTYWVEPGWIWSLVRQNNQIRVRWDRRQMRPGWSTLQEDGDVADVLIDSRTIAGRPQTGENVPNAPISVFKLDEDRTVGLHYPSR